MTTEYRGDISKGCVINKTIWLVCGGRDFDSLCVPFCLSSLINDPICGTPMVVIAGGASGADSLAKDFATSHGIDFKEIVANWSKGKAAGFARNQEMLKEALRLGEEFTADVRVMSFPGGRGTALMTKIATDSKVVCVEPIARLVESWAGDDSRCLYLKEKIEHYQHRGLVNNWLADMGKDVNAHDGSSFCNIYSQGRTSLGRMLSNWSEREDGKPWETKAGPFRTLEGYWFFLRYGHDENGLLRSSNGFGVKTQAKEMSSRNQPLAKLSEEEFRAKFTAACWEKIKQSPKLAEAFRAHPLSEMPFVHFYSYGGGAAIPGSAPWLIDWWTDAWSAWTSVGS